jgi:rsbT co-antagonist protein RsbR
MKVTQRNVTMALLSFLTASTSLLLVSEYFTGIAENLIFNTGIGALISGGLLYVYWRWPNWAPTRYLVVITISLLIAFLTPEPYITEQTSITIFIPPALALILTTPAWVVGSMMLVYLALLAQAGWQGAYANPVTLLISVIVLSGMVLGRLIADTSQHAAVVNAGHAEEQKQRAEAQARELADANDLMSHQLDQQQLLLDLVTTLEAPAVPLAQGVLFAPMVGHIDARRAEALTNRLLHDVSAQRARLIVLDISGVTVMDTSVAQALMNTIKAIRLLGCEVTLSGISAAVAITLIHLGINLDGIATARSPQEALTQHLSATKLSHAGNGNNKTIYN